MNARDLHFNKTRLAPTPSGYLHLGNVFSFAITATLAFHTTAKILLRIDDLDHTRATPPYLQDIFDTLHFLGIPYDEGPRDAADFWKHYSQLHRLSLYEAALQQLSHSGQLFACDCSRSKLALDSEGGAYPGTCRHKNIPLDRPGVNWRVITPNDQQLVVNTISGGGESFAFPAAMKDFVVRKKDGLASYQLASVVDDHHFGIDLVVRGQDLLPSTIAQLYLSSLLHGNTFGNARFFHHSLLQTSSGAKLSKSAGDTSVQFLRREGCSAAQVFSMIADMLGLRGTVRDYNELASLWLAEQSSI